MTIFSAQLKDFFFSFQLYKTLGRKDIPFKYKIKTYLYSPAKQHERTSHYQRMETRNLCMSPG